MDYREVSYGTDGPVAIVRLNRPRYRNAQSWRLLDELDAALSQADADPNIRAIVLGGEGEHFSAGHDLGSPPQIEERERRGASSEGIGYYENFRKYNLDLTMKWRNLSKPTIAMVHGYCIYGGWMIAAAMDVVFASDDALFLAGLVEYFSIPWDIGVRKAKELIFESRFITANEAMENHWVNRVLPRADLERETLAYAQRVAENAPEALRLVKRSINNMQDAQGFSQNMETAFHEYLVYQRLRQFDQQQVREQRQLPGVGLALRRLRGEAAPAESENGATAARTASS